MPRPAPMPLRPPVAAPGAPGAPKPGGEPGRWPTCLNRLNAYGAFVNGSTPNQFDEDGDGVNDLLVGQFGEGILWVYRNEGTNARPKLAAGKKFKDGREDGRVPTG